MFIGFIILGTFAGGIAASVILLLAESLSLALLTFSVAGSLSALIASGVTAMRRADWRNDPSLSDAR
jgi:hypothetical protein